jgi:nitroimidazol reductase NimA-like FMN-containing flavoprotein (pyridoxamine 5'-phosphate oxidase superfamily)
MSDSPLEVLDPGACMELLRSNFVGRIAFDLDGYPVVFPVNYLFIEDAKPWLMLRTKPGSELGSGSRRVGFQIDGVDPIHHSGWSVLARGETREINDQALPELRDRPALQSWMPPGWNTWLAIDIVAVSGRRLHEPEGLWAFDVRGYR